MKLANVLLLLTVLMISISVFLMKDRKILGIRTIPVSIILFVIGLGLFNTWYITRLQKRKQKNI
jgi:preprotein translocase subunit YajC